MYSTRPLGVFAVLLLLGTATASAQTFGAFGTCTGTSASVAISSVDYTCSTAEVDASGTWSVTNADGVRLDYFIDSTLYQSETRYGTSGSWSFGDTASLSGSHSFRVDAYPVVTSGGVETTCLQHGTYDTESFGGCPLPLVATITGCTWNQDPVKAICYPDCTGSASGGTSPYSYTWGVQDSYGTDWEPTTGPTIRTTNRSPSGMSCRCGYAGIWDTVVFEVEDADSSVDTDSILCGGQAM